MKVSIVSIYQYNIAAAHAEAAMEEGRELEVIFKREPDNKYDSNATQVFISDSEWEKEIQLGYVSASEEFVMNGTLNAKEVASKIDSGEWDDIKIELVDCVNKNMHSKVFIAKARIVEEEEEEEEDLTFEFSGSMTLYPHKKELIQKISNDVFPELEINKEGIVSCDGEEVGSVLKRDEAKIFSLLKDTTKLEAIPISAHRGIVKAEVVLNNQDVVLTSDDALKKSIDEVIKRKALTKKAVEERVKAMQDYGVSNTVIKIIIDSYVRYEDPKIIQHLVKPKTMFEDEHGLVKDALSSIAIGDHLRFEGPKGTGKNTLTEVLAWLTHRPLYELAINSEVSNMDILGFETFVNDKNGNPVMTFQKSQVLEAFINGGIIVLDEFNTGTPHVLSLLNSFLDHRKRIHVKSLGLIEGHDNFLAITTENKGYTGTFPSNEATVDRLAPVIFPNPNIKRILESKYPKLSVNTLNLCQNVFNSMIVSVENADIDESAITIRGFESVAKKVLIGVDLKEALIQNIANRAEYLEDREVIKEIIDLVVG